jgi:hypothetical protein
MELAHLILEYIQVLIWPIVVFAICIFFRSQLTNLLNRLKHADLPGGVSVDLGQDITDAKELSSKVQATPSRSDRRRGPVLPLTEANTRMIQLDLRPSPSGLDMGYYRQLADQDPNIALAGLRIEVDIMARNLAKGFKVPVSPNESGTRLLRALYDQDAIDAQQMQLVMKIMSICNAAVHGSPVSHDEALMVIDTAAVLADQYLAWLSWGFNDGWKPTAGKENDHGPTTPSTVK